MPEDIEYGWSCIKFSKKEKKEYQLLITPNIKIFIRQRKKRQVTSVFGSTLVQSCYAAIICGKKGEAYNLSIFE